MNEVLEALEELMKTTYFGSKEEYDKINNCYETIKQSLTELKAIKETKPSEAIEQIKTLRGFNSVELNNDKNINKSLDVIEQALQKAQEQEQILKIIKKKDVDMYSLRRCETIEDYNTRFTIDEYQKLTQEEFDLLKR